MNKISDQDYFAGVENRRIQDPEIIRSYGITSDIIAYRLCPRNYGFFKKRNFIPSTSGQLFFGTIIHNVFDQAHLHYSGRFNLTDLPLSDRRRGFEGSSAREMLRVNLENLVRNNILEPEEITEDFRFEDAQVPNPLQLGNAFVNVENSLRARGVLNLSRGLRMRAFRLTQIFNKKLGGYVYPKIVDTEHTLEHIGQTPNDVRYLMHGVVDLITEEIPEPGAPIDYGDCVIWDYKGGSKEIVEDSPAQTANYDFQLQTYVKLFQDKNGTFPKEANLIFVGSLLPENEDNRIEILNIEDPELILERIVRRVEFNPEAIDQAFEVFEETIDIIDLEHRRSYNEQWRPLAPEHGAEHPTPSTMCQTCELRWSCESPNGHFSLRTFI